MNNGKNAVQAKTPTWSHDRRGVIACRCGNWIARKRIERHYQVCHLGFIPSQAVELGTSFAAFAARVDRLARRRLVVIQAAAQPFVEAPPA